MPFGSLDPEGFSNYLKLKRKHMFEFCFLCYTLFEGVTLWRASVVDG